MNKVYFAGGCFWCIGEYFRQQKNILDVVAGYSGGDEKDISYLDVKSQKTKHRETIEISYEFLNFEEILDIAFKFIDPFDSQGQYIDRGYSYTLAYYYQTREEKEIVEKYIKNYEAKYNKKVAISIEPFKFFIKAEEIHQKYALKHPKEFEEEIIKSGRSCHLVLKK